MLFDGKVAIVSGSGPGMGREIALALAREGADVAVAARRHDKVARVAEKIEALGRRALPVRCDVTDPDQCRELADRTAAELGGIDVLVNNAYHDGDFAKVVDADLSTWQTTIDVNLFGAVHMTRAVHPHMKQRGGGRIVMVNTMSTERVAEGFGIYAASKSALKSITRTLAKELGPDGIRVNGVHPGYIWGPSVKWYFEQQAEERGITPEDVYAEVAGQTALGYIPDAAEIAGVVLLLASDLARCVTGQALGANAGQVFH
ncbi:SDR family oxidoreductase [Iamia sp. SCSIO 61187]|uniref:SDR family oxidoreductase n=1 Tax=Iamia sp. SCSIO 61187 TaxID=2722752 RepID=UPI001C629822|nr:SDR family oxidoreductase [Iamia sp. SCSIO 61187]QYG92563.1 SDR family oxidoreductase [Iamia sp. SCSIO 61187]